MKVFSLHFTIIYHPKQIHYAYSKVTSRGRGEKNICPFSTQSLGDWLWTKKDVIPACRGRRGIWLFSPRREEDGPCTKKAIITAGCGKHGCARSVSYIFLWAFLLFTVLFYTYKVKAIPVQAWTGSEGSRRLKFSNFKATHEGGKVVSPAHCPPLPPRKCSWCSFLLEAEWTPGP